ncbi:MAG: hypothetical protein H6Q66_2067 [Firmicutes bacterium]|nr:hypothetical protein [Bacillota bacterium]
MARGLDNLSDFSIHDPYRIIIPFLYPDVTDNDYQKYLTQDRELVRSLRQDYSQNVPRTDYENDNAKAYMLAYFPYYVETLYHLLEELAELKSLPILREDNIMNIVILGGGPMPELLGIASHVKKRYPRVEKLKVSVFDINDNVWKKYRHGCTVKLLEKYGNIKMMLSEHHCDFLSCEICQEKVCKQVLGEADLVVMQNCISDIIGERDRRGSKASFSFAEIFKSLRFGALFLLCDLDYSKTNEALRECVSIVEGTELGTVLLKSIEERFEYRPNFVYPTILNSIFDGSDHLMQKNKTKSKFIICQREDWVTKFMRQQSTNWPIVIRSLESLQYCNRYTVFSNNHIERIDVFYKKNGLVSNVKTLDQGNIFSDINGLRENLIGKCIHESAPVNAPLIDPEFQERAKRMNFTIEEIRRFPYMQRYIIRDSKHNTGVVDQYFNGLGRPTRRIGQLGMSTSEHILSDMMKIFEEA